MFTCLMRNTASKVLLKFEVDPVYNYDAPLESERGCKQGLCCHIVVYVTCYFGVSLDAVHSNQPLLQVIVGQAASLGRGESSDW